MATMSIFATVGTTQFNKFVEYLTSSEVLKILKKKGYSKLTLQIGNGDLIPECGLRDGVEVEYYRFKDSIAEDMNNCDLILSHAGAGSCLEALEAGKPLLVIVNEDLMDNHQCELAKQFNKQNYLYYCNCDTLARTLQIANFNNLTPYVKGNPKKFSQYLNDFIM